MYPIISPENYCFTGGQKHSEMKERIKEFIEYKGITAGELASNLDVQRSNISHILNGRNKPGAALIEKLLLVFPDLNARWLLTGAGGMLEDDFEANDKMKKGTSVVSRLTSEVSEKNISSDSIKTDKPIDKVVILYTDGTFSSYERK